MLSSGSRLAISGRDRNLSRFNGFYQFTEVNASIARALGPARRASTAALVEPSTGSDGFDQDTAVTILTGCYCVESFGPPASLSNPRMIMNMYTPRKLRVEVPQDLYEEATGGRVQGCRSSRLARRSALRRRRVPDQQDHGYGKTWADPRAAAAEQQLRKPGVTVDSSDFTSKTDDM